MGHVSINCTKRKDLGQRESPDNNNPYFPWILLKAFRFIGRRGLPETMFSDNATNFVGASNVLKELQEAFLESKARLTEYAAERAVHWKFIPPRAPHFGGLWEAAVKAAKHRLLRGAGNANLTPDELSTHLVDVEALLNSRPLVADTSDPNDGEVITPGHLLIGQPLLELPHGFTQGECSSKPVPAYLKRWRQLSELKLLFWRKWSRDYLLSLQQRVQWSKGEANLVEGAVVLVHDDNSPPQRWITGRVTRAIAGEDGKVPGQVSPSTPPKSDDKGLQERIWESVKISCSVMDRMLKLSDDEEHSCASKSRRASHNQLVQNRK
ncbi:hypothetical protein ACLKA7_001740 [Drosophila subpalustris]